MLGKHSGRHALRQRVIDLGYRLSDEQLQHIFDGFKSLADRKKVIYDADIEALCEHQIHSGPMLWTLEAVTCNAGNATIPSAVVALWHQDGTILREASLGDGPVDAVFKAIERITGFEVTLRDYRLRQRLRRRGRPGRGQRRDRVQRQAVHRPGGQHRHHRGQRLAFLQVINRIALRTRHAMDRIMPTEAPPLEETAATAGEKQKPVVAG